MNRETFDKWQKAINDDQVCPVCGKPYLYRHALFTHLSKKHSKEYADYVDYLVNKWR